MKNRSSVCYQCPDRWVDLERGFTCHCSCERYAEEVAHNEKVYAERKRLSTVEADRRMVKRYGVKRMTHGRMK